MQQGVRVVCGFDARVYARCWVPNSRGAIRPPIQAERSRSGTSASTCRTETLARARHTVALAAAPVVLVEETEATAAALVE